MTDRTGTGEAARRAVALSRQDWADPGEALTGHVEGRDLGTGVTVLFFATDEVGAGPGLHFHPYDEIFILREGRARITVGGESFDAVAGQIVLGPAGVAHRYVNLGPGRLATTDIHVSDRWIQTDLDDPGAAG